jgi:rubrerythrin
MISLLSGKQQSFACRDSPWEAIFSAVSICLISRAVGGHSTQHFVRNIMATSESNLKDAFAGESQANRKYLAFARKAEQEGFSNVARLFRTAAEAETIHALGHLSAMGGIQATADNLRAAIEGETYEYSRMYPPMLQQALADEHKGKRMFGYALKAEAVHAKLYQMALDAVAQGKDLAETQFYLCPVCGHIELGAPPASCPICGANRDKFMQV